MHRALVICSKSKLQQELDSIRSRSIFRQNGYPEVIINLTISKKIARFYQPVKEGPLKCPAYLKLPWIGNISLKFEKQVKSNVTNCFSAVELRVIFQTRKILPSIHKDAIPTTQQSLVVYQHVCRCNCRYRGSHILKITEESHSTHFQLNSKQRIANESSAQTKLQSQDSSKSTRM